MRNPWPGPDADTLGACAGKETDADLRFDCDVVLRGRTGLEADGTGDAKRLLPTSLNSNEEGLEDEDTEVPRLRSMFVAMSFRVSADGASSSSL